MDGKKLIQPKNQRGRKRSLEESRQTEDLKVESGSTRGDGQPKKTRKRNRPKDGERQADSASHLDHPKPGSKSNSAQVALKAEGRQSSSTSNQDEYTPKRVAAFSKKRKVDMENEQQRRPKKKKKSSRDEVVDNLDKLIEQYRSKLSGGSNKAKDPTSSRHKEVRRWFESAS